MDPSLYPVSIVKILEIIERVMQGKSSGSSRVYNPLLSHSAAYSCMYIISDRSLSKCHGDESIWCSTTTLDIRFQC